MTLVYLVKSNIVTDIFTISQVGASVVYKNKQYYWAALSKCGHFGVIRER